MKTFGLAALTNPVSEAQPCGPDLEAADDEEYLTAIVTAETVLPPEYFVFSDYIGARQPFDLDRRYSGLDLGAQVDAVAAFAGRTRDLRLLALLAKLYVLAKDLGQVATCLEAVAVLLEERWDDVHPRPAAGDEALRRAVLQRLDDALVTTALQHVPLFVSKRHGPITAHRYAAEVRKEPGGVGDERVEFDRVLTDEGQTDLGVLLPVRDDLVRARDTLRTIVRALARIRTVCTERMAGGAPDLAALRLPAEGMLKLIERLHGMVEGSVGRLDPGAVQEPAPGDDGDLLRVAPAPAPGSTPAPVLGDLRDATAALAAVASFFGRSEPSNPALLLLAQAQGLVGKSFVEAMQILLPDHAAKAALEIGAARTFTLPLARLTAAGAEPAQAAPAGPAPAAAWPPVTTRAEAVAILDQVGAYFRLAEPSSPIPMLTDGARALIGKDFMALLGDVLPKDALKAVAPPK